MNFVIARGFLKFRQNGGVLDKADKLHLNRSSLSPESSTVVHRWLFNRLTEILFNAKVKEKSICLTRKNPKTALKNAQKRSENFKPCVHIFSRRFLFARATD